MKRLVLLIAALLQSAVLADGYVFAGGAFTHIVTAPPVTVPNVVGGSLAAADTALEGAGLDTGLVTMTCSAIAANQVLSQNPLAGAMVSAGSTVDLVASNGVICRVDSNRLNIRIGIGL